MMLAQPTKLFTDLYLWHDTQPRTGAENMAIDQMLMQSDLNYPVLRVYQWSEPTISFGYFMTWAKVQALFRTEDVKYVRRWSGGGVVDHRIDVTYTLTVPRGEIIAKSRGAESYRLIHHALANVLRVLGETVLLGDAGAGDGGEVCFMNPVEYDLTNLDGDKVAGAGQRRSRYGLLHQGSVIPEMGPVLFRDKMPALLADELAKKYSNFQPDDNLFSQMQELANVRYASDEWLMKS